MMAATHRLGGLAFGMVAGQCMGLIKDEPIITAALIGGAVLGSLLPDIDNPKSFISRKFPPASMLVSLFQMISRGIASLLPKKKERYIRSIVAHRGITHSLTMCVLIGILLGGISAFLENNNTYTAFCVGIVLGIISHIFLDMLAGGSPLFCPFINTRITLARIKTGGIVEWLFRTTAILILANGIVKQIIV